MLKQRIDKAAFDALPDVMKAEYKPNPSNAAEYLLDTEEATEALAARNREKLRADGLQAQIDTINADLAAARQEREQAIADAALKGGDAKALNASWEKKFGDATADAEAKLKKLNDQMRALLVTAEATRIAAEISTVPELIVGMIERRLVADVSGEVPITRVVDAEGKPSALSVAELAKEFVANPKFAAIIKASDATGGGAGGGSGGGGAPTKKLSEMTEPERVELSRKNPQEFRRLQDAARAEARTR